MQRIQQFISIVFGVISILVIRKKEKKWAIRYIQQMEQQFDGKLSKSATDRAVVSYSGFIPMISDAFTQLRRRKSNHGEKERIMLYFLCSSLFDDFCDEKQLSANELYRISFEPELYQPTRFEERLFLHAHLTIKNYVKNKDYYDAVTKELFKAQLDSVQQLDPQISNEEIQQITMTKGGSSTLLCHFYLDLDAGKIEQNCWRQLGVLLQFTDDLMDLFDDLKTGMQTLPTRIKNVSDFHTFYEGQIQQMQSLVSQLPFPLKQKQHLIMSLVGICSLGNLVLQQLQNAQGNAPQITDLPSQPRQVLIIDMEKPKNILYCVKFTYRQIRNWSKTIQKNADALPK